MSEGPSWFREGPSRFGEGPSRGGGVVSEVSHQCLDEMLSIVFKHASDCQDTVLMRAKKGRNAA